MRHLHVNAPSGASGSPKISSLRLSILTHPKVGEQKESFEEYERGDDIEHEGIRTRRPQRRDKRLWKLRYKSPVYTASGYYITRR